METRKIIAVPFRRPMGAVKHEPAHQAVSLHSFGHLYCKSWANVRKTFLSCGTVVNQQLLRATCQSKCRTEVSVSLYDAIATPRISTKETGPVLPTQLVCYRKVVEGKETMPPLHGRNSYKDDSALRVERAWSEHDLN
jgi:hypothetical protein